MKHTITPPADDPLLPAIDAIIDMTVPMEEHIRINPDTLLRLAADLHRDQGGEFADAVLAVIRMCVLALSILRRFEERSDDRTTAAWLVTLAGRDHLLPRGVLHGLKFRRLITQDGAPRLTKQGVEFVERILGPDAWNDVPAAMAETEDAAP